MTATAITGVNFRRGTGADIGACFEVFFESVVDLTRRMGTPWETDSEGAWTGLGAIYERLSSLMSSRPFGQFDRFLGFQPPFIL